MTERLQGKVALNRIGRFYDGVLTASLARLAHHRQVTTQQFGESTSCLRLVSEGYCCLVCVQIGLT